MKKFTLPSWDREYTITLHKERYACDNSLAIEMTCWDDGYPEPYDSLTTNVGVPFVLEGHAFVQTDKYVDWIVKNGIGERTGVIIPSGFNTYELIKFNMDMMEDY